MKILYVCHRFPFPPKRGGKIRPFNMIKHLAANHEVTVASLARSPEEAREGQGIAPFCAHFEMARGQQPDPGGAHGGASADAGAFVHGLLLFARSRAADSPTSDSERFDLIFVHCSSVAQYVADVRGIAEDPRFRRHGFAEVARVRALQAVPAVAGLLARGQKLEREERRLAGLFDMCTATTRAEWETLESYRTGVATDWFPNGVDSGFFAPVDEAYDADTISFVGRMDYYPNQECMFDFCANMLPRIRAASRAGKTSDRRRGPVAGDQEAGRTAGGYGHRLGAGRAPVRAPLGADGGAAQHRPRHAEQDPGGDGDGRAGGDQRCRCGRRGCRCRGALPGRRRLPTARRRGAAHPGRPRRAPAPRRRRPRAHAVAPRLGPLDAASRRGDRAMPRETRLQGGNNADRIAPPNQRGEHEGEKPQQPREIPLGSSAPKGKTPLGKTGPPTGPGIN